MILACPETRIELPRQARISTRINNRIPYPRPARYQSHRRAAKSRSRRYAMPIAGSSKAPPESSAFSDVEMLRVASVNQEDRYQSADYKLALEVAGRSPSATAI